jgi:quercetin dioxygenase-like cupin family protein
MSSNWRPDDSLLEKEGGELRGARRVRDALKKHSVETEGRIVTSRDKGMENVSEELKRGHMPPGFEQTQVPVALGPEEDVLAFVTTIEPGAELPEHAHEGAAIFRLVVAGSVRHRDTELSAGDWMLVPPGERYGLKAGSGGCTVFHFYFPWAPGRK